MQAHRSIAPVRYKCPCCLSALSMIAQERAAPADGSAGRPSGEPSLFPEHGHRGACLSDRLAYVGESRGHRPVGPAASVRLCGVHRLDGEAQPQLHADVDVGTGLVGHEGQWRGQAPHVGPAALRADRAGHGPGRQAEVRPDEVRPGLLRAASATAWRRRATAASTCP